MLKILTIVGARPQFIKAATVSRAIGEHNKNITPQSPRITELVVHTGQHYDDNMSAVFFQELGIQEPYKNLRVGPGPQGWQTAQMLMRIERVLLAEKPDWVLVYGDTNSTLAGALAAVKLHVPVAHVEAGLRSFNRNMPEEYNRVISDHLSSLLFCPAKQAVKNLEAEGIADGTKSNNSLSMTRTISSENNWLPRKVALVGDVMYDSVLHNTKLAKKRSKILEKMKLKAKCYALATVHRAENTDNQQQLKSIFYALERIAQDGLPIIVPLHPRTQKELESLTLPLKSLELIDPVFYLDMLMLEKRAQVILTDSGGVQKEAYWFRVPCVTLRDETEWVETVESGWNVLAGSEPDRIIKAVKGAREGQNLQDAYGKGRGAERIVHLLSSV